MKTYAWRLYPTCPFTATPSSYLPSLVSIYVSLSRTPFYLSLTPISPLNIYGFSHAQILSSVLQFLMSTSNPTAGSSSRNNAQQQRFANAFATLYGDEDRELDEGVYNRGSHEALRFHMTVPRFPISMLKGHPHIMATSFNK